MKNLLCSSETEIPEVDNTDIPCDVFYSSECVVMQNLSQTVRNYFNIGDTPTLTEYAEAVALALKDARERIITLENSGGGGGTPQPNPQLFRVVSAAGGNILSSVNVYEDGILTQTITEADVDFFIDINKQIYLECNGPILGVGYPNEIENTFTGIVVQGSNVLFQLTEGTYNLFKGVNNYVSILLVPPPQ